MSENETFSIKEMIKELRIENNKRFDKVDSAQAHTNGDVTTLKIWRGYITGGLAVITILVIPVLIYVIKQNFDTRSQLQTISDQQQTYEINK